MKVLTSLMLEIGEKKAFLFYTGSCFYQNMRFWKYNDFQVLLKKVKS